MPDTTKFIVTGPLPVAGVASGGTVTAAELAAAGAPVDLLVDVGHLAAVVGKPKHTPAVSAVVETSEED